MNETELMHPAPAGPESSPIEDAQPYLPPERNPVVSFGETRRLAVIGVGVALLILVIVFSAFSHKSLNGARDRAVKRPASRVSTASDPEPRSLSPIVEARPAPLARSPANFVDPEQVQIQGRRGRGCWRRRRSRAARRSGR